MTRAANVALGIAVLVPTRAACYRVGALPVGRHVPVLRQTGVVPLREWPRVRNCVRRQWRVPPARENGCAGVVRVICLIGIRFAKWERFISVRSEGEVNGWSWMDKHRWWLLLLPRFDSFDRSRFGDCPRMDGFADLLFRSRLLLGCGLGGSAGR